MDHTFLAVALKINDWWFSGRGFGSSWPVEVVFPALFKRSAGRLRKGERIPLC
jgi:hypothetical protein